MVFSWIMGSRFGKALAAFFVAAGVFLSVYLKGKSAQKHEDEVQDLKDHIQVKEEIDDVSRSTDRDAAIDRLRGNLQRR